MIPDYKKFAYTILNVLALYTLLRWPKKGIYKFKLVAKRYAAFLDMSLSFWHYLSLNEVESNVKNYPFYFYTRDGHDIAFWCRNATSGDRNDKS
ncbi:hypothetical protein PTD2_22357 [Pseudoalteromonas tunicata D2]|jgi:hypothetical protein|uniref:Uncharacterized protein n=1 Tax=Pseudoalteromonas tunicata D2 TaxID=87626 RepID=A4CB47_9GAMM|nr:hypothetical protein PTD2_22357 [Pseudoalteromonas tunicata D2]